MFRYGNRITAASPKRPEVPGARLITSAAADRPALSADKRLAARTKPKRTLASTAA